MNIGFSRWHRRRRSLAALLSAAALVAASVVATAGPAQAADESIAVNFSAGSGSPTYRASGAPPPGDEHANIEAVVQYWHGSPAVRDRLHAVARASASVVLFQEPK
ncbi:hypothetical protein OG320_31425 [Microbispora sp. NBC_01189]|uniref:hypothetical protein n=1 Tax=Microbispora sp. NBC_01189 TaxID=2903583 RepID=UPI002E0EF86C|nr:hypothetical protein OG320_31425 [Microbispora sp. NBC_01189]